MKISEMSKKLKCASFDFVPSSYDGTKRNMLRDVLIGVPANTDSVREMGACIATANSIKHTIDQIGGNIDDLETEVNVDYVFNGEQITGKVFGVVPCDGFAIVLSYSDVDIRYIDSYDMKNYAYAYGVMEHLGVDVVYVVDVWVSPSYTQHFIKVSRSSASEHLGNTISELTMADMLQVKDAGVHCVDCAMKMTCEARREYVAVMYKGGYDDLVPLVSATSIDEIETVALANAYRALKVLVGLHDDVKNDLKNRALKGVFIPGYSLSQQQVRYDMRLRDAVMRLTEDEKVRLLDQMRVTESELFNIVSVSKKKKTEYANFKSRFSDVSTPSVTVEPFLKANR